MLTLRPDLDRLLMGASGTTPTADDAWARQQPAAARLSAEVAITDDVPLELLGQRLRDWTLHRRSGLLVRAEGPARPGSTVALAVRIGPLWATAPCRVVAVHDETDRVGFRYATLPGHPERGVEDFVFERGPDGIRFRVEAVSVPAFWAARLAPFVSRVIQRAITRRYLTAAAKLANN